MIIYSNYTYYSMITIQD